VQTEPRTLSESAPPTKLEVRQPRLGRLLIERGVIGAAQLNAAMVEQRAQHRPLREILVEQGSATARDVAEALAALTGTPFVDLHEVVVDDITARRLPEALARRLNALPVGADGSCLVVAMIDPGDVLALDDLHLALGDEIEPIAVEREQLFDAIDSVWHGAERTELVERRAQPVPRLADARRAVEENEIVQLVYRLLHQAVAARASDVHAEVTEDGLVIRFRVDGVLHDVMHLPKAKRDHVIARLKVMTAMDISDHRLPQDGRMTIIVDDRPVDVRAVVLPTAYGESVVLRILDKHQGVRELDELGMSPASLLRFRNAIHHAWGLVVVTGPTGSGKSTSLYAAVHELNDRARNIITIEDPIEFLMTGVKQMQVSRRAGLTFATALRSVLRADPDVVLVGEIRDVDTVQLASEAALTGHLVLSTLHTNDAASTPMRLLEMGLEPYLVTSALDCVVAQRLVRRLCEHCREPVAARPDQLAAFGLDVGTGLSAARGCTKCDHTGYRGRFAIHEVMPITDAIRELILDHAPSEAIRTAAVREGMETMREAGKRYLATGETSIDELTRVLR